MRLQASADEACLANDWLIVVTPDGSCATNGIKVVNRQVGLQFYSTGLL
jgi:hypothetical protein